MTIDLIALENGKLANGYSSGKITLPEKGILVRDHSSEAKCTFFCDKYRYFVLILGLACLTSISSNMVIHNFTVIVMSPSTEERIPSTTPSPSSITTNASNDPEEQKLRAKVLELKQQHVLENSLDQQPPTFAYSRSEKGWLNWVVAIGSVIGTFPFNWLYTRYGARWVLFSAGMLSTLSTALIPLTATHLGIVGFLILRFIQGFAYSANFAATGMICTCWASLKQNAFFISVLTGYTPLSSTLTNIVSGELSESRYGWPMAFYAHAIVAFILFVLWAYFYTDRPKDNNFVSEIELERINRNKSQAHINLDGSIPYRAILSDYLVWCCWINAFLYLLGVIFMFTYIPTYFKNILGYSVEKTGIMGALPGLTQVPMKIAFGYTSDKYDCCSERLKMIFYNTTAVALPGLMFLAIGFVPSGYPFSVVFIFILVNISLSAACGGFYKCAALYTRQYSHFIIANIQFTKSISLFVAPVMMTVFVADEKNREQWRIIFIILAVALVAANLLFCQKATAGPANFTIVEEQKHEPTYVNGTIKDEVPKGDKNF